MTQIQITNPLDCSEVTLEQIIGGTYYGERPLPLIVPYVFSGDGVWYPQEPAVEIASVFDSKGNTIYWRSTCYFGDDNTKAGYPYVVIALQLRGDYDHKPQFDLPLGSRSNTVRVLRAKVETER